MKKSLLHCGVFMMLLLLATACSNNGKMEALLERIPVDVDMVLVGNVKTVVESAGGTVEGSQIKLPAMFTDEMSSSDSEELDKFLSFLKSGGVDVDACALFMNYKDGYPFFVFSINDQDKFKRAIEDEKYVEREVEDGTYYYSKKVYEDPDGDTKYDDYGYLAVNGSYAYWVDRVWVGSDFKPIKLLRGIVSSLAEKTYAQTSAGAYIASGNAAGAAFKIPSDLRRELKRANIPNDLVEMYEGTICFKGDLSANAASVNMKWFDEDGKEKSNEMFNKYIDVNAKVDQKALAYLHNDEQLVYAVSMKGVDWDKYMEMMAEAAQMSRSDRGTFTIIKSYLEKFDGTVAVGLGVTGDLSSLAAIDRNPEDAMKKIAMTMVCETKEGKAKGVINDLKSLLESANTPYEDNGEGFSIQIPNVEGAVYVAAKGNLLVFSNREIKEYGDNAAVKAMNFSDYIGAMALVVKKDNPLLKDLGVEYDYTISCAADAKSLETVMCLQIDGNDSRGVVGRFAKTILDIVSQKESIQKKVNPGYYEPEVDTVDVDWDGDYEEDYTDEDSVVAEEWYD